MNKAIFLDRDGVINIEKNYLHKAGDFEFVEGVFDVLKKLQTLGYIFVIVTNQSGIGRGYYTQNDFDILTAWMLEEFEKNGVKIAKVNFCPHAPEEICGCRKPSPKMILDAANEFNIDLQKSWMVGDKFIDIESALNAGIPKSNTIQVKTGHSFDITNSPATFILDSISQIYQII